LLRKTNPAKCEVIARFFSIIICRAMVISTAPMSQLPQADMNKLSKVRWLALSISCASFILIFILIFFLSLFDRPIGIWFSWSILILFYAIATMASASFLIQIAEILIQRDQSVFGLILGLILPIGLVVPAVIAIPNCHVALSRGRDTNTVVIMMGYRHALEGYYKRNGHYPLPSYYGPMSDILIELRSYDPLLKERDGWGHLLIYRCLPDGEKYMLISTGKDEIANESYALGDPESYHRMNETPGMDWVMVNGEFFCWLEGRDYSSSIYTEHEKLIASKKASQSQQGIKGQSPK